MERFDVEPIGVWRTPFVAKADAPIQGVFAPDAVGTIEIADAYAPGLKDLDLFTHLIVLYVMDRVTEVDLLPVPFLDDVPHGVFATRNPRRPNRIGLSVVRLDAVAGNVLHVRDVDALDGTPVIDVKPYVRRFDAHPDASEGWFADKGNRPKPAGRE